MQGVRAIKAKSDCQWFKDSISGFIILLSSLLVLLGMNDIRYILGDTQELWDVPCFTWVRELCECQCLCFEGSRPCSNTEQEPEWWKKLQFLVINLSFSIWQISLACASWIPCLSWICGAQKMSVFDFRIPLVGAGHCLADFSHLCVHQKAGLGCLNIFIFNVELKRKMTVFESSLGRIRLLIPIFWVFFVISSKLLIIEDQLIAGFYSWLSSVNATRIY